MGRNEMLVQLRAGEYGFYGRRINQIYHERSVENPSVTFEECQLYAKEKLNIFPPKGYEQVKRAVCYTAVYLTAWQADFIGSERLAYLRSDAFRRAPLKQYLKKVENPSKNLVRESFRFLRGGVHLYWFFRRAEYGIARLNGPVAHLMFALDGINAAGSNNYTGPGVPPTCFASHNLNEVGLVWLPDEDAWSVEGDEGLRMDILWTPLDVLLHE